MATTKMDSAGMSGVVQDDDVEGDNNKKKNQEQKRIVCDSDQNHVTILPPTVRNLLDCVRYELNVLQDELEEQEQQRQQQNQQQNRATGISDLEDSISDGFMIVDLAVLQNKLRVWNQQLFPNITPYFAIKCHPDPMVVQWLALTDQKLRRPQSGKAQKTEDCDDDDDDDNQAAASSSSLGYDCASIPELQLAINQLEKLLPGSVSDEYEVEKEESYQQTMQNHKTAVGGGLSSPPITRIVYANPQRAEADLLTSIELFASSQVARYKQQLWMTLDGPEEAMKIRKSIDTFMLQNSNPVLPDIQIIIRLWVPDGHSTVPLGEKFGVHGVDGVRSIAERCISLKLPLKGVSFHCGSGCSDVDTYRHALKLAQESLQAINEVIMDHNNNHMETTENSSNESTHQSRQHQGSSKLPLCTLIDIGGGWPGYDGKGGDEGRFVGKKIKDADDCRGESKSKNTTVADIAEAIRPDLQFLISGITKAENDVSLTLIAEPGRYFVEAAACLASRIYQKRIVAEEGDSSGTENGTEQHKPRRFYRIPHGVGGVFKDVILCDESFIPQPLRLGDDDDSDDFQEHDNVLYPSTVLGPSGEADDVVCRDCLLPDLTVGDMLVFDRMGAYTLSIANQSGRPVTRYVFGGGTSSSKSSLNTAATCSNSDQISSDDHNHDAWRIALYYIYVKMSSSQVQEHIHFQNEICEKYGLQGRIRISIEGINGVLSGRYTNLKQYERHIIDALNDHADTMDGSNTINETALDMKFCRLRSDLTIESQLFDSLIVKETSKVISLFNEGGMPHRGKKKKKSKSKSKNSENLQPQPSGQNSNVMSPPELELLHENVMKQKTPSLSSSSHLSPDEWNRMLDEASPGSAVLLDVRNVYESKIGRFEHSKTPTLLTNTRKFSDLIPLLSPQNDKNDIDAGQSADSQQPLRSCEKIFMYCTGGVRCERVSFLVQELYPGKEVYQLKGGIQRYLEQTVDTNNEVDDVKQVDSEHLVTNIADGGDGGGDGDVDHKAQKTCYFRGRNFVFDPRRTDPVFDQHHHHDDRNANIVGRCINCGTAHDDYDNGHAPSDQKEARCNTCRMLVLLCNDCRKDFISHGEKEESEGKVETSECDDVGSSNSESQSNSKSKKEKKIRRLLFCNLTHCGHEGSTPELEIVGGTSCT